MPVKLHKVRKKRVSVQSKGMNPIKELMQIPGVGKSIANDLLNIGITKISQLKNQSPEELFRLSNKYAGVVQDRCLLYVFRCAVYFASEKDHEAKKLNWWYWKDETK